MKTTRPRSKINQEAVEQASSWFVEFRVGDADAAAREDFNIWLRHAPENVQAYLEIARTYAELPAINPAGKVDVDALIAYARSDGSNVIPLSVRTPPVARPSASVTTAPRKGRAVRAALAASVLLAVAGTVAWLQLQRGTYSTDIGEQRSITLADGSTIELNARTRIRLRLTERERGVELLEGQALFQVAKDKQRPFIVRSDGTQVRAVGTQFDVYRRKSGTTVTVLEGRVAVLPAASQSDVVLPSNSAGGTNLPEHQDRSAPSGAPSGDVAGSLLLVAGEQVTVTREHVAAPTRTDVAAATAWTQRRLVFDASPLTQVAEEFNRYTSRRLIVDDAQLQDFHISGVYSSTDPASLVRFLRVQPGIQVTETDTEIRISRK